MAPALYNENDPFVAAWLRNLIADGHIAPGNVDERSIEDLRPSDVAGPGQRHFFAGIAGWSRALRLAGVPDDADVWSGSCPCQPISGAYRHVEAGTRRRGSPTDDDRHLWPAWFRLIDECKPELVIGEQVANQAGLAWFDAVCADLEGAGYAVAAADLPAASVGAPHIRQRLWFVAARGLGNARGYGDRQHARELPRDESEHEIGPANSDYASIDPGFTRGFWSPADWLNCTDGVARPVEPGTQPMVAEFPTRVGRLRAYGNAFPPEVAAVFIKAALEALR